ncbi:MAG: hypothetical protein NDF55_10675 [archaeon GB-1867-005]|nr:hypothetical protein [Candidatus Culexmicrobium cathedralense]
MLAIAPRYDEATEYSYKWIKKLMEELEAEYTPLFESDATRENFEKEVENHSIVVFYDHGDEVGLYAQGGRTYVIDKRNNHLLKGKIIYTMACLWGIDGGIDTWKKGAKVVWAYKDVFAFTNYDEELFMECANYGLIIVIKEGVSWEEAVEKAKKKFDEAIEKAEDGWTKIWLRHDRDALVCYTENNPPETSTCMLRQLAIKLFGAKRAWKLRRAKVFALMLTCVGYGIALHDFAHQVWELKGTSLSLEGGYIGFIMMLAGLLLLFLDHKV